MTKFGSLMLLLCTLVGCNNNSSGVSGSVRPEDLVNGEGATYLALGDSYTIGESVAQNMRWPVQLVQQLRKRGLKIEDPRIIAKTGWTTNDLLQAMDQQLENEQHDLVSVLIGVNNQYQNKSIEEYEEDLNEIFTRAIDLSNKGKEGVFVVSIPDYGVTPFGASNAEEITKEIDEFNTVFRKVAGQYDLDFYNITPISKKAKDVPNLTADDGLHPSGGMYSLWVEEFVDEVTSKIE